MSAAINKDYFLFVKVRLQGIQIFNPFLSVQPIML